MDYSLSLNSFLLTVFNYFFFFFQQHFLIESILSLFTQSFGCNLTINYRSREPIHSAFHDFHQTHLHHCSKASFLPNSISCFVFIYY